MEVAAVVNDGFDEMGVGRAARMKRFSAGGGGGACSSSSDPLQRDEGFLLPVVGTVSICRPL